MKLLSEHYISARERLSLGIPPLPLSVDQTRELTILLSTTSTPDSSLLHLLSNLVPAGVSPAALVKAEYLDKLARGTNKCPTISAETAITLLGTMLGGYNVPLLVSLLDLESVAAAAANVLKNTLLVFDHFNEVREKSEAGNIHALSVLQSWADAEWFTSRPALSSCINLTVLRIPGEINTDDLSPAKDASSRPDIPLHALSFHRFLDTELIGCKRGEDSVLTVIEELKRKGFPLVYTGDVVGTGSSRKSAINSLLWWTGQDIPFVPNKRAGGICFGNKIAPIFFNSLEDAGALPIELDVSKLKMGDHVELRVYDGVVLRNADSIATFKLKSEVMLDAVQAGGRIPLIVGRGLTSKARDALGLRPSTAFRLPQAPKSQVTGFTLAQKMVGRAIGLPEGVGVRPGTYCEPKMTSVGSQDGTGPMTKNELTELACLGFGADLVMQSFCHTAAYPNAADVEMHQNLPTFMTTRGAISLRPGDGIIHSWLNRMLLPDTVGTGADSHTRFPIGISFPAGSGLVAFAAATGVMPLDMPESVLVRFKGDIQPGITIRDLVHAIPYQALKEGHLNLDKNNKKNIFSGKIIEIEGLPDLKVEQAFEFADATAERSAAACTIRLNKAPVAEYIKSNIALLQNMANQGYEDKRALERRVKAMQAWENCPTLLEPDHDAEYSTELIIDLATITEPLLCCPNDPDNVKPLSEVTGTKIDEVFIGSCMTNIGHFRAASKILENKIDIPTKLWIAPPTKMDAEKLQMDGYFDILEDSGARLEIPGCSLCVGNQAVVNQGSTVMSTSTRNFPNRMGKDTSVFLSSAELASICSLLGFIPSVSEYHHHLRVLDGNASEIYSLMDFSKNSNSTAL